MANNNTALVKAKEQTIDVLSKRIKSLQNQGELHFPPDYSPQNALKAAWLEIQRTKNKDHKLALEVCTPASIYNALFDMVITGLNPAKKQGYFIVYGKQLTFQRSYFGSEALAKRVDPTIEDIVAEPVYDGDEFEYEIVRGKKTITKHKQTIESVDSKKVKAAYCIVIDKNGEEKKVEIMTYKEILKAWSKSPMNPVKDGKVKAGSTHDDFLSEMVRKTVINRACKSIFNSSDDKYLKIAAQRSEVISAEEEAQEEIDANANQEIIDIEPEPDATEEATKEEQPQEVTQDEDKSPEKEYLTCPTEIDKKQPRKPISVCQKCKNKGQCNSFVEWAMDNEPAQGESEDPGQGGEGVQTKMDF